MPVYDLNNLGDKEFEMMVQSLLKRVIASDTITFGDGPDGGREAVYTGKAPYPSETDNWDGKWIFQAKFHNSNRIGPPKARENIKNDIKNELDKIKDRKIDNYILATNVVLTSFPESGTLDEINNKIIPNYTNKIKNIRVWGYDDVCRFLDNNQDVRAAYLHLITPGDVLAKLFKNLLPLESNQLSHNEIKEYLDRIIETKYESHKANFQGDLRTYYINHRCKLLPISYWKAADDYLLENDEFKITDALELVNEILANETFILIGSQFGMGKSTFAKMLAIIYAINFLTNTLNKEERKFFPIYVNLLNGLYVDYKHFSLENFIRMLSLEKNIQPLLILDGLDEIRNSQNLHDELEKLRSIHHDLKIIITCRIQDDIFEKHNLSFENYIRLLPFSQEQFDLYCQKFQVHFDTNLLTFKRAEQLNFPIEVLSIPLFLLIFYEIFQTSNDLILINSNWSPEMTKSFIFLKLFHNTIIGKYLRGIERTKNIIRFREEKKALRLIAALHWIFPSLTFDIVTKYKKIVLPDNKVDIKELPFINFVYETKGNVVYFLKKIYLDYLLAEYYLEAILERKVYKLSLVPPTIGTTEFLSGLLLLLKESVTNEELKEHLISGEFSLVNSIVDSKIYYHKNILDEIEYITLEFLKKDNYIGWHIENEDQNITIKPIDSIWINANLSNSQTEDLLIHKWILLFVNRKINDNKYLSDEKIKNNIAKLIKIFSNVVPPSLRYFPYVDLSGCNLSGVRLRDANLEGAHLEGANLESADLNHAIMKNTKFTNANLSYADLSFAKAQNAIFENANLEGATLRDSDFSNSNFNGTRLTGANLFNSNFESARLHNIDIFQDITSFNIGPLEVGFGPALPLLICDLANFKNAKFNDKLIVKILKKRGAIFSEDNGN